MAQRTRSVGAAVRYGDAVTRLWRVWWLTFVSALCSLLALLLLLAQCLYGGWQRVGLLSQRCERLTQPRCSSLMLVALCSTAQHMHASKATVSAVQSPVVSRPCRSVLALSCVRAVPLLLVVCSCASDCCLVRSDVTSSVDSLTKFACWLACEWSCVLSQADHESNTPLNSTMSARVAATPSMTSNEREREGVGRKGEWSGDRSGQ